MAAMATFDLLSEGYSVLELYTFGEPRMGNAAWVKIFEGSLATAGVTYFRVTDYKDPIVHLSPKGVGYLHPGPEVYYSATRLGAYKICAIGEDKACSDQWNLAFLAAMSCYHCSYLGLNPCDFGSRTLQCEHLANDLPQLVV